MDRPGGLSPETTAMHDKRTPVLMAVEGIYDIAALKALSALLHAHDIRLPDLAQLEAERRLLFLPIGGSNIKDWVPRVASLGKPALFLIDREVEPETSERRAVVKLVNQQPGCTGLLTAKRALENYLSTSAIAEVCGIELPVDDDSDLPGALARRLLAERGGNAWQEATPRTQKRLREKAKRILNVEAVKRMTPERLAERDVDGEVAGWLQMIAGMAAS